MPRKANEMRGFFPLSCFVWGLLLHTVLHFQSSTSIPQHLLLSKGCSQYEAINPSVLRRNLDASLTDIRSQLRWKKFAVSNRADGSDPVYALAQFRDYVSRADYLSCFTVASRQLKNCSTANGARVVYDGCFLRYESSAFFDQTMSSGNVVLCDSHKIKRNGFGQLVARATFDVALATPRISGFFAAVKYEDDNNSIVYAMGQCMKTASESGCADCLGLNVVKMQGCLPSSNGKAMDAGCFLRYSASSFFHDNQAMDITPFLRRGISTEKKIILGGVGGVALLLILSAALLLFTRWKSMSIVEADEGWHTERGWLYKYEIYIEKLYPRGDSFDVTELRGPVNFRYSDLKSATNNFSQHNKLGEGGFGGVYKAVLKNGKVVAVKKLMLSQSQEAKAAVQREVKLISNVHHTNMVRLLGCCSRGHDMLLVYEYMPNKSLDIFLYGEKKGTLSWSQRFNIIVGTARGLSYLHREFHMCIIHRDIKSSNILLDNNFNAKIADFGLVGLLPEGHTHLTTRFAGTFGYTAPEYAVQGRLSEGVDTYGFGIVVLEIISGRRSNDLRLEPQRGYLLELAWKLYESGSLLELVDPGLNPKEDEHDQLIKVAKIALLCTQSSPSLRPIMSEVLIMLLSNGDSAIPEPARPDISTTSSFAESTTSSSLTPR